MRGGLWLCLALLLVPLAAAHHDRGRLVDIRLGDDDRDDDDRRDDDGDDDRRGDRDDDRDDDDRRGRDRGDDRHRDDAGKEASAGCIQPSGGATETGNVVSWPAQDRPVDVHRKQGDDTWQKVHEAAAEDELFVDKDLKKGRSYAYRVAEAGAPDEACPVIEMTAVPFAPAWAAAGATAGCAVLYVALRRR